MEIYVVGIMGFIALVLMAFALQLLKKRIERQALEENIDDAIELRPEAMAVENTSENEDQWEVINVATRVAGEEMTCPQCGSNLELQHGNHGSFYGCSSFPNCKYSTRK